MRSNRKRHEKNYIVVKCESKAYEKFQFAIRNGVCEPQRLRLLDASFETCWGRVGV